MIPNWRCATGSPGAIRSTSRYCFSALAYWSAAYASFARARSSSLVGSREQAELPTAIKSSATKAGCQNRVAAVLVTGAVTHVVEFMAVLPCWKSVFWDQCHITLDCVETMTSMLVAPSARRFNGLHPHGRVMVSVTV